MIEISDSLLLDGLRKGNEEAFNALFLRYHGSVYGVLFRLLGDRDQASDLTQETFLKLYRHPPSSERTRSLGAWLYRVALNSGYNALRGEDRRNGRELRVATLDAAMQRNNGDPAGVVVRQEERALVRRILAALPQQYQAALVLRYGGSSYAELAEVLDIGVNAVGVTLARAEKQFKTRYLLESGQGREEEK